jgi:hypothetical protein
MFFRPTYPFFSFAIEAGDRVIIVFRPKHNGNIEASRISSPERRSRLYIVRSVKTKYRGFLSLNIPSVANDFASK